MSVNGVFERMLRERLGDEEERLKQIVTDGTAIKDFSDYKHTTGKIAGLRLAIEHIEGVNSDLDKAR